MNTWKKENLPDREWCKLAPASSKNDSRRSSSVRSEAPGQSFWFWLATWSPAFPSRCFSLCFTGLFHQQQKWFYSGGRVQLPYARSGRGSRVKFGQWGMASLGPSYSAAAMEELTLRRSSVAKVSTLESASSILPVSGEVNSVRLRISMSPQPTSIILLWPNENCCELFLNEDAAKQ